MLEDGGSSWGENVITPNKFDHRSIPSIFIGYPHGIKGYKLLNLTTKSVFISRNVVFHEHIFS